MSSNSPLGLPAAPASSDVKLDVDSDDKVPLDNLGPMVVNSDGTLSRIANWSTMTEAEQKRTLKVLGARNQLRLAARKEANETEGGPN
ncbi:hypothetical protein BDP27DRAFT_141641 [Rhodocollybia butyracea]|uniref:Uncharacterized protein n=1 Tax=Rhodocollybia butyracea TaxID=206335 RepID=A0A9P5Q3X5_9AGAR|nr:hypothetical protein BDP27DRAFT_141641 [Rhodocollybia butyracea]